MAVVLFLYVCPLVLSFWKLGRGVYFAMNNAGRLPMNRLLFILVLMSTFCVCMWERENRKVETGNRKKKGGKSI
jgi:hypothetical protein